MNEIVAPSVAQQLPFGVMGPGFRQDDDEDDSRFKLSHHAVSSPAHAGDPVFQRRLVTIAKRPSCRGDAQIEHLSWVKRQAEYFLKAILTGFAQLPVG
ncbi:hypothetical protein [Bradyrhizobium erythrophlei]|uniref:hypothetical protein n=1 Tax=Bradyrhizobium erythrophlei TaxID=1437360 RepID=UPI00115FFA67|nr:hypothetical protein [Bradyrhizobium erythrophlei]